MVIHLSDTTVFAPMRYERARKTGISQQSGIRKLKTCYLSFSANSQNFSRWEVRRCDKEWSGRLKKKFIPDKTTELYSCGIFNELFSLSISLRFSFSTSFLLPHSPFRFTPTSFAEKSEEKYTQFQFRCTATTWKISFENFHQPFVLFYALILQ